MPTSTASPGTWPTRVIIIDDHEISRAAFIALLRAEGINVTAGLRTSDQVITVARAHPPRRGDHRRDASGPIRSRLGWRPDGTTCSPGRKALPKPSGRWLPTAWT
jgi:hypothetical protein